MARVYPDGVVVRHTTLDGTEFDDLRTYIKSADDFSDLTKRLALELMRQGAEIRRQAAGG